MMERLELARQIVKEAGDLTLKYFNNPELVVEKKADGTPVTVADRGAEELLRQRIIEYFPNDAILGEEFPLKEGISGWRWILDPIDGTKSFIKGVPLYSTLIGVEQEGVSQIGVIWIPPLGEGVWAERGQGAWREHPKLSQPIRAKVSEVSNIADALFLISEIDGFDIYTRRVAFEHFHIRCGLTRTWGDAYGYYLVATGQAEIMLDAVLGDWDAGPLLTILEEAGGHFTDWKGNPTIYHREGVATNDALFQEVISTTKRYPKVIDPREVSLKKLRLKKTRSGS